MAYEQVAGAQVSSSGVQGDVWQTLEELPVGTEGYISFSGPGIGPLMDAWGAELIAKGVFWAKGVDITVVDCYGVGLNTGYIKFRGSPVAVVPIILALAPLLTALAYLGIVAVVGIFIWKALNVIQKLVENPWAVVAIGTFVLGGLYLAGRRNENIEQSPSRGGHCAGAAFGFDQGWPGSGGTARDPV